MKRSIIIVVAICGLVACSGSEDSAAERSGTDAGVGTPQETAATTQGVPVAPGATVQSADQSAGDTSAAPDTSGDGGSVPAPSVVGVPVTGVPGLDSADAFCAAWSRFGGSWQVLLVGSSFTDDPSSVVRWEVAAAPVITRAYDELLVNFPDELAVEYDAVADGYFGVLARRSADAVLALEAAGPSDALIDEIATAWTDALARRDPFSPEIALEVSDEAAAVLVVAGDDLSTRRVEFHLDPSMVVGVETPLTDAFLETACPDQGSLSGQEVGGG